MSSIYEEDSDEYGGDKRDEEKGARRSLTYLSLTHSPTHSLTHSLRRTESQQT